MNPRTIVLPLALLLVALMSSVVSAHLMPAGKGTLNVVGSKVYIVVSLPVPAFFKGPDAKTELSQAELLQLKTQLREQVREGIRVRSDGATATFDEILLSLPSGEGHDGTGDVDLLVMIVAAFSKPPSSLQLSSSLWAEGKGGLLIEATISEGSETLQKERGELSRKHSSYRFFSPKEEGFSWLRFLLYGLGAILALGFSAWVFRNVARRASS